MNKCLNAIKFLTSVGVCQDVSWQHDIFSLTKQDILISLTNEKN